MKPLNRLYVTSGLFVALCALTSFNPFSQNRHFALASEGSITLAQQLPAGSRALRNDSGTSQNRTDALTAALQKIQAPNASHVPAQTAPEAASEKPTEATEAGACTDGKCGETQKPQITAELVKDARVILDNTESEDAQQNSIDELVICENKAEYEGDYKEYLERLACYNDAKRKLGKTGSKKRKKKGGSAESDARSQIEDILLQELEDLIAEIKADTELKTSQKTKLYSRLDKLVRGTDLTDNIRAAKTVIEVETKTASFEKYLNGHLQSLSNVDNQIRQFESMNNGMNPQGNYQVNMLYMQRQQILNTIEKEVAGFQEHVYKRALPATTDQSSDAIVELKADLALRYSQFVTPIAPMLDPSLSSLDATSYVNSAPAGVGNRPITTPGIVPNHNAGQVYNPTNPGASMLNPQQAMNMSPAQQVQHLLGQNGSIGIQYNSTMQQTQNQMGPMAGQPNFNQPGKHF